MPVNTVYLPYQSPWESKVNLELEGFCFVFFAEGFFTSHFLLAKKSLDQPGTLKIWDVHPIETGGFWKTRETNIAPEN